MTAVLPILGFALAALAAALAGLAVVLGPDLRFVVLAQPWWLLAALLPLAAVVGRALLSPRPATLQFSRASSWARRFSASCSASICAVSGSIRTDSMRWRYMALNFPWASG